MVQEGRASPQHHSDAKHSNIKVLYCIVLLRRISSQLCSVADPDNFASDPVIKIPDPDPA